MAFVVAIDGPAGSGKGTITKLVGEKMNLISIDTGAMYRSLSLYMIKNNIALDEIDKIEDMLKKVNIELKKEDNMDLVYLDGENVTKRIREKDVNEIVSPVSHMSNIREAMVDMQRKMAQGLDVIMEGRDIGTNVFPNADVKIYLDCSIEERARRRYKQNLEKGIEQTYEEVLKNIKERHKSETERELSPLVIADDAIYIDTTTLSIDEVVEKIVSIIKDKIFN